MVKTTIEAVFALSLSVCAVEAQTCPTYPNALTNGQPADANQVMANFNSIRDCLNSKIGRELLTANRIYYIRTDGSDANAGLVDNAAGAFLTIQKAINVVRTLDLGGFAVTIQVRSGTYNAGVSLNAPFVGGTVALVGDTTTPSNVVISTTNSNGIVVAGFGSQLSVGGFKFQTITAGSGLLALAGGVVNITGKVEFGAMANGSNGHHMYMQTGVINITSAYTISGSAQSHWFAAHGGAIFANNGLAITLTGTPAFSITFAWGDRGGILDVYGNSFSGSATGSRYVSAGNSVVFVNGGGASYLPGSAAGSLVNGGQYY